MRVWLGAALLASSWLWGVAYYQPAAPLVWLAALAAAVAALYGQVECLPSRRDAQLALLLGIVPVWWFSGVDRAAPLTLAAGLLLALLPGAAVWPKRLADALLATSAVLLAQRVALFFYAACTARWRDVPGPLASLFEYVLRCAGIDTAQVGERMALHSMRQPQGLALTWDLLADPSSVGLIVGGLTLLGLLVCRQLPAGARWRTWLKAARDLALVAALWLPVRAVLLAAVYWHRDWRFHGLGVPHLMNHFLAPGVHFLLTLGLTLLAWRFVRLRPLDKLPVFDVALAPLAEAPPRRALAACGLLALAAFAAAFALHWDPVGSPQRGRVLIVERHSAWEPTTVPYDTKNYGEKASYTYTLAYDWLSQFFRMGRLTEEEEITPERLSVCDVLVIKTPTARYEPQEVDAVARFVEGGGGLLLVGEHTNFSRSSTYLNDVARRFGFTFRNDLLFGMNVAYDESYRPPTVPHPAVQYTPDMEFAVSCSIDPGVSSGRAAIQSAALWSLPPDYNMSNYFPFPYHQPTMRYGAFIQLWTTRHGEGRVAAFTDSTIFSSFSLFEPGQSEFLLGLIEWLNYSGGWAESRAILGLAALALAAAGLWFSRRSALGWPAPVVAGCLGWALGSMAVIGVHRATLPLPQMRTASADAPLRLLKRVTIDRTASNVPLAKGGFVHPSGDGYGLLEQWIPRVGGQTMRRSGAEAFQGDALVVICPTLSVSPDFRERLVRYVAEGGRLLVLDAPENANSTANSLLWPFGLSLRPEGRWQGDLLLAAGGDRVPVEQAEELSGGEPLARVGDHPVAVRRRYEKGLVMAVGFASLFNDRSMGLTWTVPPAEAEWLRYELLFAVLRGFLEDQPIKVERPQAAKPAASPARPKAGALPGKAR